MQRALCVFRLGQKTEQATSCMGCYHSNKKCSAASGAAILGVHIAFKNEEEGSKLLQPSWSVRNSFVSDMVKKGALKEWPYWLNKTGKCEFYALGGLGDSGTRGAGSPGG